MPKCHQPVTDMAIMAGLSGLGSGVFVTVTLTPAEQTRRGGGRRINNDVDVDPDVE